MDYPFGLNHIDQILLCEGMSRLSTSFFCFFPCDFDDQFARSSPRRDILLTLSDPLYAKGVLLVYLCLDLTLFNEVEQLASVRLELLLGHDVVVQDGTDHFDDETLIVLRVL